MTGRYQPDRIAEARRDALRDVRVVIRYADAEAAQAARITQINVVTVLGPDEVIDEIERVYDCRINGGPTAVVDAEFPVCSLCGDYLHGSTDAHPELEGRLYDTSGDDECIANRASDGSYGPHVFDGKTRPADTDGEYPRGGADDDETTQH